MDQDVVALGKDIGLSLRISKSGKTFCEQCGVLIILPRGDKTKTLKQHLKSHKKMKAVLPSTGIALLDDEDEEEEEEEEEALKTIEPSSMSSATTPSSSDNNTPCWLCRIPLFKVHVPFPAAADDPPPGYCHAPKYCSPPSVSSKVPFFTRRSGALPEVPSSLVELLDLYCVGKVPRLPNVDVENQHVDITSLNNAGKVLLEAESQKKIYWAAFAATDLQDPEWWPKKGEVPGYTQVIIGSGATDIGVHQDKFFPPDGDAPIFVNTYITIAHGSKQVLMLPPSCDWINELPKKFPSTPPRELIDRIVQEGGFFFDLTARKEPITLFIPKGWWHWLLGKSNYALIYGSSRF